MMFPVTFEATATVKWTAVNLRETNETSVPYIF